MTAIFINSVSRWRLNSVAKS